MCPISRYFHFQTELIRWVIKFPKVWDRFGQFSISSTWDISIFVVFGPNYDTKTVVIKKKNENVFIAFLSTPSCVLIIEEAYFKSISYFSQYSSINIKIYRNFNQKSYLFCFFSQKCFFQIIPLFKTYEDSLLNSPNWVYRCEILIQKIFILEVLQKLIFGIFTAIFVKKGGWKRDKIGHFGQNTQLKKNGRIQNFSYSLP